MTIKVYPGAKRPSHQISLSDGVQTFGLRLEDGPQSVQEIPVTPSTVHFTDGGTKFGDWEPGMSHIEQRTWEGGRANDSYVDDPTRYADSKMAWTLTPGKVFPVPNWKFSGGYLGEVVENLPGDLGWRALYGSYLMISQQFTHSDAWSSYDKVFLWVRKVGNPTSLVVRISADAGGEPGVEKSSGSISAADYEENILYLVPFDLSGGDALVSTTSHIEVQGVAGDDAANHWEIGVDVDGGTGMYYTGGDYYAADFSIYFRVSSSVEDRKWHFFEYQGALYAVDERADGGASSLYINGTRGVVTSAGSDWMIDNQNSWAANQHDGDHIRIVAGKGAGQRRMITVTTATPGAYVSPGWEIIPDSTSQYVIYHTDTWNLIFTYNGVVKNVAVMNEMFYVAQGQSVDMQRTRWNPSASPPAHEKAVDGTNNADIVVAMFDAVNGNQVYVANVAASTIRRAAPVSWGTNLTLGAAFDVGGADQPLINFHIHEGKLYVFKPDGRYWIKPDDTAEKTLGEIGFIRSENNGEAALSYGLYSYFSWGGYAIQRLYDSSGNYDLTNVGPDRDDGLPDDRRGKCIGLIGTPAGIMAAIQSDGYSSVMVLPQDGIGWHEVFRGWVSGERIEGMYMQDSYRPRLWISIGGEMVYQDWPSHSFNPLKDSGISFYPEAQLVSSTFDMGVSRLPKLIKEISAAVENLCSDVEVHLDYQTNEDVGTDVWMYAGVFQINPADSLLINAGEVYQIRFRLRLLTKKEHLAPVVTATVLEGFARTPVKYQWHMRLKISSIQRVSSGISKDVDPDEFVFWLKDAALRSKRIFMRSIWLQMDSKVVVVEPPRLFREFTNDIQGYWGGSVELGVREL